MRALRIYLQLSASRLSWKRSKKSDANEGLLTNDALLEKTASRSKA